MSGTDFLLHFVLPNLQENNIIKEKYYDRNKKSKPAAQRPTFSFSFQREEGTTCMNTREAGIPTCLCVI